MSGDFPPYGWVDHPGQPKVFWYDTERMTQEEAVLASRENSVSAEALHYDSMAKKGLGIQQEFTTGATRSADTHKIDFEGHLSPDVLHYFGEYMHKHRVQRDGQTRASDNWQEGIPPHKYMKSLQRHNLDLWRAWRGTVTFNPDNGEQQTLGELLCAMMFNVQGLMLELMERGLEEGAMLSKEERQFIEKDTMFGPERR